MLFGALVALSCTREGGFEPEEDLSPVVCEETYIDGICSDKWTYFSFEKGEVVGQSDFYDKEQDELWHERTDWDIAFCEDRIKTNGGTSGKGMSQILMNTSDGYNSIVVAPSEGYLDDEISDY